MNEEQQIPLSQIFEHVGDGMLSMAKAIESFTVGFVEHVVVPFCNDVQYKSSQEEAEV